MAKRYGTDETRARYHGLRERMLRFTAAELKLEPELVANGRAFGVMMDFKIGADDASIYCSNEAGGYVHAGLYTSTTFMVIGENFGEAVNEAARAFIELCPDYLPEMTPTTTFPGPRRRKVRFYAQTEDGVLSVERPAGGELADLEEAGHGVVVRISEVVEAGKRRPVN